MKGRKHVTAETLEGLRFNYLVNAAWYWFRAEGPDETLESAIRRSEASRIAKRCAAMGYALPVAEEVKAYAADRWPAHKIHQSL